MELPFGDGVYIEDNKVIEGQIILSDHKLFLKDDNGDLAQTYIPLEKIQRVKKASGGAAFFVRPTVTHMYTATIKGKSKAINDLLQEIVMRRGLKKKFLRREWEETSL